MGNEKPHRRTRTNNNGLAATRASPAAKASRVAARAMATRARQVIRRLPRQNKTSSKKEIYNTKKMRALKEEGTPKYKIKMKQEGK